MKSIFQFKQFAVDQTGCAMKINTDGVLLGAMAEIAAEPSKILDIGTGTGVIALMLAQRFQKATIHAVEIDQQAAKTAALNFKHSRFNVRLKIATMPVCQFFEENRQLKFDLIVSNPPFHLNALESTGKKNALARHTDKQFFIDLFHEIARILSTDGEFWLIVPVFTAVEVKKIAWEMGLKLKNQINIASFENDVPHREILSFALHADNSSAQQSFHIYDGPNVYSAAYVNLLKDFFTIF
jgi:tRNA1Val (adenine37-N6)-methyltransferase